MLRIDMFERLLALFEKPGPKEPRRADVSALQRAAAVLLVIAARLDGDIAPNERNAVIRLLRTRLGVADARGLFEEADEEAAASTDFYQVTRIIKDRLEPHQRAAVIEMLWEVAYADGEVHDYEANLIRRVAGLLHVEDRDAGEARRRVVERSADEPREPD
ncbi:MAG: TerB family tellurite resistance protein [Bacteroidota bacterium]|jgi:uncharacterized tellurite resistance protein B-like protein